MPKHLKPGQEKRIPYSISIEPSLIERFGVQCDLIESDVSKEIRKMIKEALEKNEEH